MSRFGRAKQKKWTAPTNPLEAEATKGVIEDLPGRKFNNKDLYIARRIDKLSVIPNPSPAQTAELNALVKIRADSQLEAFDASQDDSFASDFQNFLQGRMKMEEAKRVNWPVTPAQGSTIAGAQTTLSGPLGDPDEGSYGVSQRAYSTLRLNHLPGVQDYLDKFIDARLRYEQAIERMKQLGPVGLDGKVDLDVLYVYYKYVVRGVSTGEDEFLRDWKFFDKRGPKPPGSLAEELARTNELNAQADERMGHMESDLRAGPPGDAMGDQVVSNLAQTEVPTPIQVVTSSDEDQEDIASATAAARAGVVDQATMKEFTNAGKQFAAAAKQLGKNKADNSAMVTQLKNLATAVGDLQAKLTTSDPGIGELKTALTVGPDSLVTLMKEVASASRTLHTDLADLPTKFDNLAAKIENVAKLNSGGASGGGGSSGLSPEVKKQFADLTTALAALNARSDALEKTNNELNEKLTNAETEKDEALTDLATRMEAQQEAAVKSVEDAALAKVAELSKKLTDLEEASKNAIKARETLIETLEQEAKKGKASADPDSDEEFQKELKRATRKAALIRAASGQAEPTKSSFDKYIEWKMAKEMGMGKAKGATPIPKKTKPKSDKGKGPAVAPPSDSEESFKSASDGGSGSSGGLPQKPVVGKGTAKPPPGKFASWFNALFGDGDPGDDGDDDDGQSGATRQSRSRKGTRSAIKKPIPKSDKFGSSRDAVSLASPRKTIKGVADVSDADKNLARVTRNYQDAAKRVIELQAEVERLKEVERKNNERRARGEDGVPIPGVDTVRIRNAQDKLNRATQQEAGAKAIKDRVEKAKTPRAQTPRSHVTIVPPPPSEPSQRPILGDGELSRMGRGGRVPPPPPVKPHVSPELAAQNPVPERPGPRVTFESPSPAIDNEAGRIWIHNTLQAMEDDGVDFRRSASVRNWLDQQEAELDVQKLRRAVQFIESTGLHKEDGDEGVRTILNYFKEKIFEIERGIQQVPAKPEPPDPTVVVKPEPEPSTQPVGAPPPQEPSTQPVGAPSPQEPSTQPVGVPPSPGEPGPGTNPPPVPQPGGTSLPQPPAPADPGDGDDSDDSNAPDPGRRNSDDSYGAGEPIELPEGAIGLGPEPTNARPDKGKGHKPPRSFEDILQQVRELYGTDNMFSLQQALDTETDPDMIAGIAQIIHDRKIVEELRENEETGTRSRPTPRNSGLNRIGKIRKKQDVGELAKNLGLSAVFAAGAIRDYTDLNMTYATDDQVNQQIAAQIEADVEAARPGDVDSTKKSDEIHFGTERFYHAVGDERLSTRDSYKYTYHDELGKMQSDTITREQRQRLRERWKAHLQAAATQGKLEFNTPSQRRLVSMMASLTHESGSRGLMGKKVDFIRWVDEEGRSHEAVRPDSNTIDEDWYIWNQLTLASILLEKYGRHTGKSVLEKRNLEDNRGNATYRLRKRNSTTQGQS